MVWNGQAARRGSSRAQGDPPDPQGGKGRASRPAQWSCAASPKAGSNKVNVYDKTRQRILDDLRKAGIRIESIES